MSEEQSFGPGNAQVERMVAWRERHKGKPLIDLVKAMADVQRRKEEAEDALKDINAEFDVLRFELVPGRMEDDGMENFKLAGVGRVSVTADLRTEVLKADQPGLFGWFEKNNLSDLITATVNASTLKAWVKRRMKEGKEVPAMIKVTPITRASITKG